ncbi:pentatricopeptide repeat-containing protein [Tanacetum coccineum]
MDARKVFDEMPVRDNVTFNTMIDWYCKVGALYEAFRIGEGFAMCGDLDGWVLFYEDVVKDGVRVNEYACGGLLNGLCKGGRTSKGKEIVKDDETCFD